MHFITFLIKNLLRRKARTLLTCLGIGVAVGTTISLLGISDNFRNETVSGFEGRGVDIVVVQKVLDQLTSDLPEETGKLIEEEVPETDDTGVALIDVVAFEHNGSVITIPFQGWVPGSFLMNDLNMVSGRVLVHSDSNQILLGNILADLLDKKTGDKLKAQGEEFEIVGIYESDTLQENRCVMLNLPKMQELFFRDKRITGLSVRLKNRDATKEEIQAVADKINAMKTPSGDSRELDARPTTDYVNSSMHIQIAQSMAWLTSIIAICVGAIGMLNTMVMSVVERVKEISILRAIGWKRSRIVKMIVGESLLLTLGGTLIGALGACLLVRFLVTLPQVAGYLSANIPPSSYLKGSCLALLVGVLGGLYPAIRAAQLMPSEGLRHD